MQGMENTLFRGKSWSIRLGTWMLAEAFQTVGEAGEETTREIRDGFKG